MKLFNFKRNSTINECSPLLRDDHSAAKSAIENSVDQDLIYEDLWVLICCYLNVQSVCATLLVSKKCNSASSAIEVWKILLWRDFPSVRLGNADVRATYREFYAASRDKQKLSGFSNPVKSLLLLRGRDVADFSKPLNLTIETLLTKVGGRYLIRIFSRNQFHLNKIYNWLKVNRINQFAAAAPAYMLLLNTICNQHSKLKADQDQLRDKSSLAEVEKLMYYAVMLGYENIIRCIHDIRPDVDLNTKVNGLCYAEIALIEGNADAVDTLLTLGACFPDQTQFNLEWASANKYEDCVCVLQKHDEQNYAPVAKVALGSQ